MIWGVMRYEWKLQLRSLVFWLGLILVGMMFYSEIYAEVADRVNMAQLMADGTDPRYDQVQMPPSMVAELEQLAESGISPASHAAKVADRMQIVFVWVALFAAGFLLDRDRLARGREVLLSRPVSPWAYLGGKYLGAVVPLLIASLVMAVAGYLISWALNSGLGLPSDLMPYLKAWAVLLVPTILYTTAFVLTLALLLGRGAAVVPIHLVYMLFGGVAPFGGNGFRLDLTTFIVRADGRGDTIWTTDWAIVLANRGLYLGLTVLLLALAALVYDWRLRREVGA